MLHRTLKVSGDWNLLTLPQILVYVELSFIMIFIVCETGEWMSGRFDTFGNSLSECRWYLFTNEMQRMYLIALVNAQQPEFVRSFGGIPCTRDSFKKVHILHRKSNIFYHFSLQFTYVSFSNQTTNAGFSYFMMLRRMYE